MKYHYKHHRQVDLFSPYIKFLHPKISLKYRDYINLILYYSDNIFKCIYMPKDYHKNK